MTSSLLFVALLFFLLTLSSLALEDRDFSKMKMANLKSFLEERGVACNGCTEKIDYVNQAIKSKDLPVLSKSDQQTSVPDKKKKQTKTENQNEQADKDKNKKNEKGKEKESRSQTKSKEKEKDKERAEDKKSQQKNKDKDTVKSKTNDKDKSKAKPKSSKSKSSSKPGLAEYWGTKTVKMCQTAFKLKSSKSNIQNYDTFCEKMGSVLSSKFNSMSSGLFSALGKSASKTLEISLAEPFKSAGESNIRSWIKESLNKFQEKNIQIEELNDEFFNETFSKSNISKWLLDTMMDKKESMFGGDDLEQMIKKMKFGQGQGGAGGMPGMGDFSKFSKPAPPKADEYEEHLEL